MNLLSKYYSSKPSKQIIAQLDVDLFGLIHFSVNTFTNKEWGYGNPEDAQLFNPVEFDAEQIVSAARDGGLKGIILVCKHHDGFCLWPTKTTSHNISNCPWRNGKGDIVREFSDACRKFGLKFGVYVSPWDRNSAVYGTAEYVKIFEEQIREVLTQYGDIFEMWFDGANGGDGWYGGACETRDIGDATIYYNWERIFGIVRELQPEARMFGGPDLRWCGNERGHLPRESTAMFYPYYHDTTGKYADMPFAEACRHLQNGQKDAPYYVLPECDFPMRNGWFYHPESDGLSRSSLTLLMDYLNTVGNGGLMNLGLVPDRRGLLTDEDCRKLRGFGEKLKMLRETKVFEFAVSGEGIHTFEIPENAPFQVLELIEDIAQTGGEKVEQYAVSLDGQQLTTGEVVGLRRIRLLPNEVKGNKLTLEIKGDSLVKLIGWQTGRDLLTPIKDPAERFDDKALEDVTGKIISSDAASLTIDLGKICKFNGFVMTPDPDDLEGLPLRYSILTSNDLENWDAVAADEGFENIQANPIPQRVRIWEVQARYLQFCSTRAAKEGAPMKIKAFAILKAD